MGKEKTIRTCKELKAEHEQHDSNVQAFQLKFKLLEGASDVYNITAPFWDQGKMWIAGRVEERTSEYSRIGFFFFNGEAWIEEQITELYLQDPFVCRVGAKLILGGVEVFDDQEKPGHLNYRTVFYQGENLHSLKKIAAGPDRMKDIRLCDLKDGRILVFTRPQGLTGGRGKIGYRFLNSLEELNIENILQAVIIEHQFADEEWGGANEMHLLKNGKVGVLSHIASFDDCGYRHYYSTAFCFDPCLEICGPMKMIAQRKDFMPGPSKRPDLEDVIFSGGILRKGNGKAELYCGVSDAEGQGAVLEDPFMEYEESDYLAGRII